MDRPEPFSWNPNPHILEKIKAYFRGYQVNNREIRGRRKYQADKLGISVGSLARYLAYLIRTGWMKTVGRTSRYAVRQVVENSTTETSGETSVLIGQVEPEGKVTTLMEEPEPRSLRAVRREIPSPLVIFRNVYSRLKPIVEQKRAEAAAYFERNREALQKLKEPKEFTPEQLEQLEDYRANGW